MPKDLVAMISGISVFSNKGNVTITGNSMVTFGDGSYCNPQTGEIQNNGSGYIKMSPSGSKSQSQGERKKTERRVFAGDSVNISDIFADVYIEKGNELSVAFEGPEHILDSLSVSEKGGTLEIRLNEPCGIHVLTDADRIVAKITMPEGGKITVDGLNGKLDVGDINGLLDLELSGTASATIGETKGGKIELSGVTKVNILEVKGDLTCELSGTAQLSVRKGEIGKLKLEASGCACFRHREKVIDTDLEISGTAQVEIHTVKNPAKVDRSGCGKLDIEFPEWMIEKP